MARDPLAKYDKLFGNVAGAAAKAKASMKRTYGPKDGEHVFWGTIAKRERRAKRAGAKKTKARRT